MNNINFLENRRNPSESKKLIQVYGFKTAIENNSKDPIRRLRLIFFCFNIHDKITKVQDINKLNHYSTNKKPHARGASNLLFIYYFFKKSVNR